MIQSGTGDAQAIYMLDRKGADVLVGAEIQITWKPKDNRVSWLFFEHPLAVNDVRVAVAKAAANLGFTLEKWIDESTLRSEGVMDYVALVTNGAKRQRVAIVPDGYFALALPDGRRASFFLELDRATVSNTRWATKIRAYQGYVASGRYQRRYHTQSLRVLIVTTSTKRQSHLQATADEARGGPLFWMTTLDAAIPAAIFTSPIWTVAGWKGEHALID